MGLIYTSSSTSSGDGRRHGLYLGGKREAKSIEKLQQWNISHILNVTPTKEVSIQAGVPNYFEKKSTAKGSSKTFVYKRIPIYDSSTSVSELETFANEIVDFISKGLYHGSVLVHCHQGISRSTTCVLLFLMRKVQLTLPDALAMIKRRCPYAQPISPFMNWLRKEERKLAQVVSDQQSDTKKPSTVVGPMRGPANNPSAKRPAKDDGDISAQKKRARIDDLIGPARPSPTKTKATSETLSRPKSWASIHADNRERPPSPTRDPMGSMSIQTMFRSNSLPSIFKSPEKEGPSVPESAAETKSSSPATKNAEFNNSGNGESTSIIGPQPPPSKTTGDEDSAPSGKSEGEAIGPQLPIASTE